MPLRVTAPCTVPPTFRFRTRARTAAATGFLRTYGQPIVVEGPYLGPSAAFRPVFAIEGPSGGPSATLLCGRLLVMLQVLDDYQHFGPFLTVMLHSLEHCRRRLLRSNGLQF